MATAKGSLWWALQQKVWNRVQVSGSMAGETIVHVFGTSILAKYEKCKPRTLILGSPFPSNCQLVDLLIYSQSAGSQAVDEQLVVLIL